jgi:hypothetical protein
MRSSLTQKRDHPQSSADVSGGHDGGIGKKMKSKQEMKGEEIMFRLLPLDMQELPKRTRAKKVSMVKEDTRRLQNYEIGSKPPSGLGHGLSSDLPEPDSALIYGLGLGKIDPFDSLPFPVTERTQYLLHCCSPPSYPLLN